MRGSSLQAACDDETGYTTSEELGDKGDAPPSTSNGMATIASLSVLLPSASVDGCNQMGNGEASRARVESPASMRVTGISASTQTQDAVAVSKEVFEKATQCHTSGVDKGVQCLAPERALMVSRAAQCVRKSRKLNSKGVQCTPPPRAPGVSREVQCCPTSTRTMSTETESSLVVDDRAKHQPAAPFSAAMTGTQEIVSEQQAASDFERDAGVTSIETVETAAKYDAERAAPSRSSVESPACAQATDAETTPKIRKRRKKAKSAVRPTQVSFAIDPTDHPHAVTRTAAPVVEPSRINRWYYRGAVLFGLVVFVLAGVWAKRAIGEGTEVVAQGRGGVVMPPETHDELAVQPAGVQSPQWLAVGGNLILGDVVPPQRQAGKEYSFTEFQWVKDGVVLPAETRYVHWRFASCECREPSPKLSILALFPFVRAAD